MLASQLVEQLQTAIAERGDHPVVSGLERSGYGEPVERVEVQTEQILDENGSPMTVVDLVLSEESLVAFGGF